MDKMASEIMGEEVKVGVTLEAQAAIKGAVGGVVGTLLTGVEAKPVSIPGEHTGIFYVAAGPKNIGFFSIKRGLFKNSLDQMLVKHSRSDLHGMEIESGVMPAAHFVFKDGTHYVMVCPRIHLGNLKKLREELVGK